VKLKATQSVSTGNWKDATKLFRRRRHTTKRHRAAEQRCLYIWHRREHNGKMEEIPTKIKRPERSLEVIVSGMAMMVDAY